MCIGVMALVVLSLPTRELPELVGISPIDIRISNFYIMDKHISRKCAGTNISY